MSDRSPARQCGTRRSAYMIIGIMGGVAIIGMIMVWDLLKSKTDAAAVAILAAFVGQAIGGLGSMLSRTENEPPQQPGDQLVVNPPATISEVKSVD